MGQGGLEPPTPRLSSVCSNQLSYWPTAPDTADPGLTSNRGAKEPGSAAKTSRTRTSRTKDADHRAVSRPPRAPGEGCADGASITRVTPGAASTARQCDRACRSDRQDDGEIGERHAAHPIRDRHGAWRACRRDSLSGHPQPGDRNPPPHGYSLKGGDPAAGSPTATLLRLHPSR
jgi:hypothetical protein